MLLRRGDPCGRPMGLAALAIALCSCGWFDGGDRELEAEFVEALRNVVPGRGEVSQFDLAELTTFDWNIAHVFRPYTSQEVVSEALGSRTYSRGIDMHDRFNLLAFTRDEGVVLTVVVSRGVCDFGHRDNTGQSVQHFTVADNSALFEVTTDPAGFCFAKPVNALPR